MLFSSSLLLLAPIVLCAPIQQWTVNNQQQLSGSNQVTLPLMNVMIHDDIQNHYENMVDEVISTHSEDILFQLAHAMNDRQSLERLLQPQATALLHHPAQETCLMRMPSMIAKHLHDLHTKVSDSIEPTLANHFIKQTDLQQLSVLNIAMDQQVMDIIKNEPIEQQVALDLSACENQLVAPPKRSLWLLLKNVWKAHGHHTTTSPLPESTTSLLQSHLDMLADNLHMEFKLRLVDLYRTLSTDVADEELFV